MAPAPHRHQTAEARHRRAAFAQLQPDRHGSIELLGQAQHLLAPVLKGLAADAAGLGLQAGDQAAVIERVGQLVAGAGHGQIERQLKVDLEPLAQLPFLAQHPHMRPQAQATHHDAIKAVVAHSGRARWVNCRLPLA
jgi:hypothetical protein